eukprot:1610606-Alexandrium_andersonii.AAC.1
MPGQRRLGVPGWVWPRESREPGGVRVPRRHHRSSPRPEAGGGGPRGGDPVHAILAGVGGAADSRVPSTDRQEPNRGQMGRPQQ